MIWIWKWYDEWKIDCCAVIYQISPFSTACANLLVYNLMFFQILLQFISNCEIPQSLTETSVELLLKLSSTR